VLHAYIIARMHSYFPYTLTNCEIASRNDRTYNRLCMCVYIYIYMFFSFARDCFVPLKNSCWKISR